MFTHIVYSQMTFVLNLKLTGNAEIDGNITLGGNITVGDATDTITLTLIYLLILYQMQITQEI